MKRIIIAVVLLMLTIPAFAGVQSNQLNAAGWDKLTESQKADVIKQVAGAADKADAPISNVTDPDKLGKWVDLGSKMGKMLGGAAKEVGIAVNDFVTTPVGMMTMALVVWHYMGAALVHIFGGLFLFIAGISYIMFVMRRAVKVERIYDAEKKDIFGRAVLKSVTREQLTDSDVAVYLFGAAAVIAVSLFTVFSF